MWLVRLGLRRPYTFIVAAILVVVFGIVSLQRMATDIFPEIKIPVVTAIWIYNGLSPLVVPASTVVVRADGPQVGVIEGSTVHFRTVTLGRDYGSEIELLGGVPDSAELVLNPSDDVIEGAHVRVVAPPPRLASDRRVPTLLRRSVLSDDRWPGRRGTRYLAAWSAPCDLPACYPSIPPPPRALLFRSCSRPPRWR
jgi:hypothetical protein